MKKLKLIPMLIVILLVIIPAVFSNTYPPPADSPRIAGYGVYYKFDNPESSFGNKINIFCTGESGPGRCYQLRGNNWEYVDNLDHDNFIKRMETDPSLYTVLGVEEVNKVRLPGGAPTLDDDSDLPPDEETEDISASADVYNTVPAPSNMVDNRGNQINVDSGYYYSATGTNGQQYELFCPGEGGASASTNCYSYNNNANEWTRSTINHDQIIGLIDGGRASKITDLNKINDIRRKDGTVIPEYPGSETGGNNQVESPKPNVIEEPSTAWCIITLGVADGCGSPSEQGDYVTDYDLEINRDEPWIPTRNPNEYITPDGVITIGSDGRVTKVVPLSDLNMGGEGDIYQNARELSPNAGLDDDEPAPETDQEEPESENEGSFFGGVWSSTVNAIFGGDETEVDILQADNTEEPAPEERLSDLDDDFVDLTPLSAEISPAGSDQENKIDPTWDIAPETGSVSLKVGDKIYSANKGDPDYDIINNVIDSLNALPNRGSSMTSNILTSLDKITPDAVSKGEELAPELAVIPEGKEPAPIVTPAPPLFGVDAIILTPTQILDAQIKEAAGEPDFFSEGYWGDANARGNIVYTEDLDNWKLVPNNPGVYLDDNNMITVMINEDGLPEITDISPTVPLISDSFNINDENSAPDKAVPESEEPAPAPIPNDANPDGLDKVGGWEWSGSSILGDDIKSDPATPPKQAVEFFNPSNKGADTFSEAGLSEVSGPGYGPSRTLDNFDKEVCTVTNCNQIVTHGTNSVFRTIEDGNPIYYEFDGDDLVSVSNVAPIPGETDAERRERLQNIGDTLNSGGTQSAYLPSFSYDPKLSPPTRDQGIASKLDFKDPQGRTWAYDKSKNKWCLGTSCQDAPPTGGTPLSPDQAARENAANEPPEIPFEVGTPETYEIDGKDVDGTLILFDELEEGSYFLADDGKMYYREEDGKINPNSVGNFGENGFVCNTPCTDSYLDNQLKNIPFNLNCDPAKSEACAACEPCRDARNNKKMQDFWKGPTFCSSGEAGCSLRKNIGLAFQEIGTGVRQGQAIWALGTKHGWWKDPNNPGNFFFKAQEKFEEATAGVNPANWQESICMKQADYDNGKDIAFGEKGGYAAYISAEKFPYGTINPDAPWANSVEGNGYINLIEVVVDAVTISELTPQIFDDMNDPAKLPLDISSLPNKGIIKFHLELRPGNKKIDIDGDGKADDLSMPAVHREGYQLTGQRSLLLTTTDESLKEVCIVFTETAVLNDLFKDQLKGNSLCADITLGEVLNVEEYESVNPVDDDTEDGEADSGLNLVYGGAQIHSACDGC